MNGPEQLFVFLLDEQRFALPLDAVERVVRAVEITFLPQLPRAILGVINVQGRVLPIISLRALFDLDAAPRELELNDQFIIVQLGGRGAALLADATSGVVSGAGQMVTSETILSGLAHLSGHLAGVIKLEDGVAAVLNPDKLAALLEGKLLEQAVKNDQAVALEASRT